MRANRSRRSLLKGAAAAAVTMPMINFGRFQVFAGVPEYSAQTLDVMGESTVIDMLGLIRLDFNDEVWPNKLSGPRREDFQASGITALHHASGIGGPDAYEQALQYFAGWNGFIARNSDLFSLVDTADDVSAAKAAGKVAVIMGVQNAEHFRSADDVTAFWDLGQRSAQLTYNSQNRLGAGSTERVDGGLSDFGLEVVAKMNEVGMLVDVSHCGDRTTVDAIEASDKPIAVTHSNARALNNHPRLKTDEAIRKLAAKGGVMGITGVRNFVRDREPTTVEHVVDHIDHVAHLTAIEHVGIGSDADLYGYDALPAEAQQRLRENYKASYAFRDKIDTDGFDHPRKFFDLTEALLRRGYSGEQVRAVLGGNFQRLLDEVWSANRAFEQARKKQAEKETASEAPN
mgnify:CR=1 FL=1